MEKSIRRGSLAYHRWNVSLLSPIHSSSVSKLNKFQHHCLHPDYSHIISFRCRGIIERPRIRVLYMEGNLGF